MTNSVSGSFVVPDGFIEEQIEGQLYQEDIGEDDEIWLIRMSSDIELGALDKKKIFLSDHTGEVNVKNIETENGKLLECYAENCEVPNVCVLLPQKSNKKLHAVKKAIKGTILISEGLEFNENAEIKSESKVAQKKNTLDSVSIKKKHNKKSRHTFDFDKSDLNYETEDAEAVTSTHSAHAKKHSSTHKKSHSERAEIKSEPPSMDWDGFPHCVSQK